MSDMEENVLRNSKGATYMSFVLDVEVVLKRKDGVKRANLAESKAKKKSQVPEETEKETEKKSYEQTEENGWPASPKKEDLTVYTATVEPTNIFDAKNSILPVSESSKQFEDKIPVPTKQPSITATVREDSSSSPIKKHIKHRLKKIDRKDKAFKGKIEKIDFLECNRIFLCNYLKIPLTDSCDKRVQSQSQSVPNSVGATTEIVEKKHKTLSNHETVSTSRTLTNHPKKLKVGRKKYNSENGLFIVQQSKNSTGDGNVQSTPYLNNFINKVATFRSINEVTNCKNEHILNHLQKPIIAVQSFTGGNNTVDDRFTSRKCVSCKNLYFENKLFNDEIIEVNHTLPHRNFVQMLTDCNDHFRHKQITDFQGLRKVKSDVQKTRNNFSINKIYTGLSDLEIRFFNDTDRRIIPQANGGTVFNCFPKKYSTDKKDSSGEMIHAGKQCTVSQTRSLDQVNQLFTEYKPCSSLDTANQIKPLQKLGSEKTFCDKIKQKRSVWQIINKALFKCVPKSTKEAHKERQK